MFSDCLQGFCKLPIQIFYPFESKYSLSGTLTGNSVIYVYEVTYEIFVYIPYPSKYSPSFKIGIICILKISWSLKIPLRGTTSGILRYENWEAFNLRVMKVMR